MERRQLGNLDVSLLGLGTSRLASLGAGNSRADVERLLDTASDLGIDFIDTADTYASSACESALGRLLSTRPGRFSVATKGGFVFADLPGPFKPLNQFAKKGFQRLGRHQNFAPDVIRKRLDGSLRRLRRDAIDVYFLHEPPLDAVRNDALIRVLDDAVVAGKIRQFGISSTDPDVLQTATDIPSCTVIQTRVAAGVDELSDSHGVRFAGKPVVANQVVATGAGSPAVDVAVSRRASESGLTRAGVLLRNAAAQPNVAVVLVGTRNPAHLRENAGALSAPVGPTDLLSWTQTA